MELRTQKLRIEQETTGTENQERLIEIINEREELQSTRAIMTGKMEPLHKEKLLKRYYNEADRSTPYHFHRNMNKKIHSNIPMLKHIKENY